jgi:L-iditol 2-dehydrogenase
MCEPASVARHAMVRLGVTRGQSVLISGAGPIGLLAAQWARIFGAERVYLFDIVETKLDYAKKLGFLAYEDGIAVDAALEGTGYSDALTRCLNAVKAHGRMVLMGNPAHEVELSQQAYWNILRKELTLTGTWNSSFSSTKNDWTASLEAMSEGKLDVMKAVSHILPLSKCQEAFRILLDRNVFKNRVLLSTWE